MQRFFLLLALFLSPSIYAYTNGMVVTESKIASQVGIHILKKGGNAIDAAVAVGYALAVIDPCCGNIGGGGFMTIHLANGKNIFINFREKAPALAYHNLYLHADKNASTQGYLAVAVPGTVAGLNTALNHFGKLSLKEVMRPAIQLAAKGFVVTPYEAKRYKTYANNFSKQKNVSAIFLKNKKPLQAGDRLIQTNLAHTLNLIATQGTTVFYHGNIAKKIIAASKSHHGILTLKDFSNYKVEFEKPIQCTYRNYLIISASPPSSGGVTLCEILGILQHFHLSQWQRGSSISVKTIVEAMRDGFIDRNKKLGDPDFIKNPVKQLIAPQYTNELSKKIQTQTYAPRITHTFAPKELTDTTHYSIVDRFGNAVSVTYTLNGFFGAGVIAGDTGFFLNNEMDDFATKPGTPNKFGLVQQDANAVAANKRPLSSMTPTIVLKNHQVFLILGSPGGPRIITTVLLTLLNIIDYHLDLQSAIDAPRFHFQENPDVIAIESQAFNHATLATLRKWGYAIEIQENWGATAAILIKQPFDLIGAIDKRRPDGAAIGY